MGKKYTFAKKSRTYTGGAHYGEYVTVSDAKYAASLRGNPVGFDIYIIVPTGSGPQEKVNG